jgi:hypothetical protein
MKLTRSFMDCTTQAKIATCKPKKGSRISYKHKIDKPRKHTSHTHIFVDEFHLFVDEFRVLLSAEKETNICSCLSKIVPKTSKSEQFSKNFGRDLVLFQTA